MIGRNYEVLREIGRGGMGVVYEAQDLGLHRRVALKEMLIALGLNEKEVAAQRLRFQREGKAAGQLSHPNIITVYDVVEDDGRQYIVMEFIEGPSLAEVLAAGRRFDPGEAVTIFQQLLAALACAHRSGVVHRDIKPSNILMQSDDAIKVADFGLAHQAGSMTMTGLGGMVGSPGYMAPELIVGGRGDARSDLFSAGVVLYEMLTSEHPFQANQLATIMYRVLHEDPAPPRSLNPLVPEHLSAVVMRMLAKDPAARFQTAEEVVAALHGAPLAAVASMRIGRPRLRRLLTPIAIGGAVLALGAIIWGAILLQPSRSLQGNPGGGTVLQGPGQGAQSGTAESMSLILQALAKTPKLELASQTEGPDIRTALRDIGFPSYQDDNVTLYLSHRGPQDASPILAAYGYPSRQLVMFEFDGGIAKKVFQKDIQKDNKSETSGIEIQSVDLDRDGQNEIVLGSYHSGGNESKGTTEILYWQDDRLKMSPVPGFGYMAALKNLDGNGVLEIVSEEFVVAYTPSARQRYLPHWYVWKKPSVLAFPQGPQLLKYYKNQFIPAVQADLNAGYITQQGARIMIQDAKKLAGLPIDNEQYSSGARSSFYGRNYTPRRIPPRRNPPPRRPAVSAPSVEDPGSVR